nr:MAG TPA: hypothetical protein [Caudoviricetes sp.]
MISLANRHTLHLSHLPAFKSWLQDTGWIIEPTKGLFEVLRARRPGRKTLLILYARMDATQHCTVFDRDMPVIRQFLNQERREHGVKHQP